MKANQNIKINIKNFTKPHSLYEIVKLYMSINIFDLQGMKPFILS